MQMTTTDPKWVKPESHSFIERLFLPFMKDERDLIFIRTAFEMTLVIPPLAVIMFLLPPMWAAIFTLPYVGFILLSYGGRYGLMLHAVGHRSIMKRKYQWVEKYIPFVLGPFMGHTLTSFDAHHMWMHHAENNMGADGSSTLPYERDNILHFMHYWARFFFMGYVQLGRYLALRGRWKQFWRFFAGELAWYLIAILAWQLSPTGAIAVFIVPMLLMRWLLMAGNFAQHAFVDVDDPDNAYRNSNNLTNAKYNHKAYNDGYHIVHHMRPAMHWTDMAKYYEDNYQDFVDNESVILSGINDNQALWVLLMTKNYDKLANALVDPHDRTHEEKIAFLKSRTQRTLGTIPSFFHIETRADALRTKRNTKVKVADALAQA
jgi:fatty acid desaturase